MNLKKLDVSENRNVGDFSIQHLKTVEILIFRGNARTGPFITKVGHMRNLKVLISDEISIKESELIDLKDLEIISPSLKTKSLLERHPYLQVVKNCPVPQTTHLTSLCHLLQPHVKYLLRPDLFSRSGPFFV